MSFAIGSLVRARGREWMVLPSSTDDLLIVRPLGGTELEVTGILTALEHVEPATFVPPDPEKPGDYRASQLLRDAVRLGFRSSAGPFRSFARLGVEPRPYQLVPLMLALKLDPVRLLIADDVGIGKTIEAGLIVRELLDRGEIERFTVLCPPPLAEQWQRELHEKFHIDAELVLPGTVAKLERAIPSNISLFEAYPYTIVSLDYIKSERHRNEFLRACPEMVIVDEAHTCAAGSEGRNNQHQRHRLVADLAKKDDRHMIFVTATPHSGDEGAFRSLLAFLNPRFLNLPVDLGGAANEPLRRNLAAHFIQRRRGDLRRYLHADTPFPQREEREEPYKLAPEYLTFVEDIIAYARETVRGSHDRSARQRVRWWSALALLRSVASSPAAAVATLRNRAAFTISEDGTEVDVLARRTVLDLVEDETAEGSDLAPPGDASSAMPDEAQNRRRLQAFAVRAEQLTDAKDAKLQMVITRVKELLREGYHPIIFCRFIPTEEYVKDALRMALPKAVEVAAVTGVLPPAEREARVAMLAEAEKRVLVCTDCLSEGINLQQPFDAVLHYDLSWNPTRHEQREGRVDRYGQPSTTVRMITCYGLNNQIDGVVLDILLKKHQRIRTQLGISVPVPVDVNQVMEAVFEGLLLRESQHQRVQLYLPGLELPQQASLFAQWDANAEREQRTRTIFAQMTIKVDDVFQELQATQAAIGARTDVEQFTKTSLTAFGATISMNGSLKIDLASTPRALRDVLPVASPLHVRFDLPVPAGVQYVSRTHPLVEGLAAYVMDQALDPLVEEEMGQSYQVRRSGVIRTEGVRTRSTLLVLRLRFHLITEFTIQRSDQEILAEDTLLVAFEGSPSTPQWLDDAAAESLLRLTPSANIIPGIAAEHLRRITGQLDLLHPYLEERAVQRSQELLAAHTRVRVASKSRGILRQRVLPQLPVDILSIALYLPSTPGGQA